MHARRLTIVITLAIATLYFAACGGPAGTNGAVGAAIDPAFSGVSPAGADWRADDDSGDGDSAVVETDFEGTDDPFAFVGPAFSGVGLAIHSNSCDPFDNAYGSCL